MSDLADSALLFRFSHSALSCFFFLSSIRFLGYLSFLTRILQFSKSVGSPQKHTGATEAHTTLLSVSTCLVTGCSRDRKGNHNSWCHIHPHLHYIYTSSNLEQGKHQKLAGLVTVLLPQRQGAFVKGSKMVCGHKYSRWSNRSLKVVYRLKVSLEKVGMSRMVENGL